MSIHSIIEQVAKSAAAPAPDELEASAQKHQVLWREFRALRPTRARATSPPSR